MLKKSRGVVHTFDPSTWEAEVDGSLEFETIFRLHSEYSQSYTEKPCLKQTAAMQRTLALWHKKPVVPVGGWRHEDQESSSPSSNMKRSLKPAWTMRDPVIERETGTRQCLV